MATTRLQQTVTGNYDGRHGADDGTWPFLPMALLFATCFLLMSWPWVLGYVTIPWDAKAHFQPQIQFLADSLARGEAPWWNPFVFAGSPQVADPQSMIFSPPFLLLALLDANPSLWAADMTVFASMLFGGLGLMLYFRDRGWHPAGALVAALVFTFGAAMAWRIQHTGQVLSLCYWPWALLFLERAIRRGSTGSGLAAGAFGAAIVLGRDQVALICIYLLVARAVWLLASDDAPVRAIRRALFPLIAGGIAGLALIAIPVLMTVFLAAESNRPAIDFEGAGRGSLHPALLITFVFPHLFGAAGHMWDYWGPPSFAWQGTGLFIAQNVGQLYLGAVPLLLIAGAGMAGRLWDREVRFFTVAAMLMLLYALGWYTPVFRAMYEVLPGVRLYRRPADAVFHVGALGAVLAGYAAHVMFTTPWRRERFGPIAIGLVILGIAVAVAILLGIRIDRMALVPLPVLGGIIAFAGAAAALWWCRERIALQPRRALLGLVAITALDLGLTNGPSTSSAYPPSYYDVLQPATKDPTIRLLEARTVADATRRDRVELAGLGFHWPNASMTHRLENTLGYNPVRLGNYSRATGAEDHVGLPDQRKFSRLMPSYRSLLADMLGLRFIATTVPVETMDPRLKPGDLRLIQDLPDGYRVYENDRALPRVLFVGAAAQADFARILDTGDWPVGFDPRQTVLLDSLPASPSSGTSRGAVRIAAYHNTLVTLEVESATGGYVVLNDVWHPWWRASIGDTATPLLRANVIFRAVRIPAGKHTVTMRFEPLSGLWRDLAGLRAKR